MPSLVAVFDSLTSQIETKLSTTVVRGKPSLGRPGVTYPIIAVRLGDVGFQEIPTRPHPLGSPIPRGEQVLLEIALIAQEEYELWQLVDSFFTMAKTFSSFVLGSETVRMVWQPITRLNGDMDNVLDFAASTSVVLTWRI